MDKYEKLYNEALEQAKNELATCGSMDCDAARLIFRLFPQLRESEDERIRKEMIDFIQWSEDRGMTRHDFHQAKRPAEWIAWLEKQKELPFVKDVVLGYPGIYFYDGERMHFQGNPAMVENPYDFAMNQQEEKQKEQKPSIFPPGLGEVHWNPIPSGKDVHKWNLPDDFEEAVYKVANFISPFNSQDELRKVSHRFAEQLLDIAKKDEQKPAWSEENEDMLNSCISSIEEAKENRYAYRETDGDTSYDHEISWLKSLRPHWKPSEK